MVMCVNNTDSLRQCVQVQNGNDFMPQHIGQGLSDDDFFHLTCHIDSGLMQKIENGEFVDLEKLLPKERFGKSSSDENRLEWVHRDGGTYLVPAQRDVKISNFRKWEQAFRAYATIYCGAHPQRSKEIWQYITVINTAALSYVWDNVYNYDITFRHLMAFNPHRSWAVTYNQMWNLSIRDPLPQRNASRMAGNYFQCGGFQSGNQQASGYPAASRTKPSKNDYCWNWNKGVKCKFGAKCRFIKRCSYCDSPTHGIHVCFKAQKKGININNYFKSRKNGGRSNGCAGGQSMQQNSGESNCAAVIKAPKN